MRISGPGTEYEQRKAWSDDLWLGEAQNSDPTAQSGCQLKTRRLAPVLERYSGQPYARRAQKEVIFWPLTVPQPSGFGLPSTQKVWTLMPILHQPAQIGVDFRGVHWMACIIQPQQSSCRRG
jgi:hypothetical protein